MSNKKILKKVLKSNIISIILLILSSYLFLQKSSNDNTQEEKNIITVMIILTIIGLVLLDYFREVKMSEKENSLFIMVSDNYKNHILCVLWIPAILWLTDVNIRLTMIICFLLAILIPIESYGEISKKDLDDYDIKYNSHINLKLIIKQKRYILAFAIVIIFVTEDIAITCIDILLIVLMLFLEYIRIRNRNNKIIIKATNNFSNVILYMLFIYPVANIAGDRMIYSVAIYLIIGTTIIISNIIETKSYIS